MAVPNLDESSAASAITASSATITVPKPTGLADGDVWVAHVGWRDGTATLPTPPTGWTLLAWEADAACTGFTLARPISSAAGEPASYDFVSSVAGVGFYGTARVSGCDLTDMLNNSVTSDTAATASDTVSWDSLTTDAADTLVLFCLAQNVSGTAFGTITGSPTPSTVWSGGGGSGQTNRNFYAAQMDWVSASATGARTQTTQSGQQARIVLALNSPQGDVIPPAAPTGLTAIASFG